MRERLEKIFEHAAVGIAQLDTSGQYLLVNDRYCELLGRSREELLSAGLQDVTHPDDLPTTLESFIRAIETGAALLIEQRCIRGDGSAVWLSNSVSAGRGDDGKPQYVVAFAQDITGRKRSESILNWAEADLRLLLDSAAEGIYCLDVDGLVTLCNASFRRMLGFEREEEVIGKDIHGLIHHSRPDGTRYPKDECPILKTTQSGTHVHVIDELFFRRDGTSFPVDYSVRPIVRDSNIEGAICTFVDLTERKQAEARQELLNRELAHRVKNTLAMVQAIVGQTLRTAATPREAIDAINQRLVALGNAHTILTRTRWGNASMMDVVEGAIAIHRSQPHRIEVEGPRVELGSKAALAITLALHELCTNAAKYGALSRDSGTVSIEWSVSGGAADASLHFSWKEQGGPTVTPPRHKGFGSRLISQAIASDLRGRAKLSFDPDGVRWTLKAPLTAIKM
ncbi:MAG TPA: PAS domain S-box protein [Woeseiaceae bacterium]|nr:PAS domain S-box protein [Woeseiaceae bacterium]